MSKTVRLMTSNLYGEAADVADFRRALEDTCPDIVVAQELAEECADVLADRYSNHYLKPAPDDTGRGIATDFDGRFGDIPMPGRPGTYAVLEVGWGTWCLAGVHFFNPVEFPLWMTVQGRSVQVNSVIRWSEEMGEDPVVIAGDLNASPLWPVYRQMAEQWSDVVSEHALRDGVRAGRTWSWRPDWPRMLRIDHVFGRGVKAEAVTVERVSGSDHSAVVVDLVDD